MTHLMDSFTLSSKPSTFSSTRLCKRGYMFLAVKNVMIVDFSWASINFTAMGTRLMMCPVRDHQSWEYESEESNKPQEGMVMNAKWFSSPTLIGEYGDSDIILVSGVVSSFSSQLMWYRPRMSYNAWIFHRNQGGLIYRELNSHQSCWLQIR